jgi:hypothetical protein
MRTAIYNDLLWHLHDLWPEQTFPGCALLSKKWATRIARRLARAEPGRCIHCDGRRVHAAPGRLPRVAAG